MPKHFSSLNRPRHGFLPRLGLGFLAALLIQSPMLHAAPLAPSLAAQLVFAISTYSDGRGRVACTDAVMAKHFQKAGLQVDLASPVAWASSKTEVETYSQAGKIVICDHPEWVSNGAAILVSQEGGRPIYFLYSAKVKGTGVYVGAAVWKFARELR